MIITCTVSRLCKGARECNQKRKLENPKENALSRTNSGFRINPSPPRFFGQKRISWTFWRFSG